MVFGDAGSMPRRAGADSVTYQQIVTQLRQAFPQPISDRLHDSYFVFSFLRALDQVDAMKSETPVLGGPVCLDYDAARRCRIDDQPQSLETVTQQLVQHLSGLFIWGHPKAQINVVPCPTIPSVIGGLLPSIYNPNLVSEESSRQVAVAEVEVAAMTAELVGYSAATSAGLFTFGGTGTLLYGVKLGLEKAFPGMGRTGRTEPAVLLCSARAHYACAAVANWLGIGQNHVWQARCLNDHEVDLKDLELLARRAIDSGHKIAAIVATMGTTDHFGLDDLQSVVALRDRLATEYGLSYRPQVHADAVIGWAWSVFNDYDFSKNPLEFRHRTVRALAGAQRRIKHLGLADSIGIDFHKTGFAPYVSSLFLTKASQDLELICRKPEETPYLFHDGHYHPGRYTLETTRSGSGVLAALANLRLFGKNGLRALLGYLVSMAETLREQLEGQAAITVVNRGNFGPVTLFRVYPDGVDTFSVQAREQSEASFQPQVRQYNEYNRRVFQRMQEEALQGRGVVISLTDCYRETDFGEPLVALKSYILSPFVDEASVHAVLESIWAARTQVNQDESFATMPTA
jgi:L-2,4-diaminobutyrate decarboxylase